MTAQLPIQKERLEKIASWRDTYGAGHNVMLPAEEAEALARFVLAAHEQEPVAWQYRVSAGKATGWSLWHNGNGEEYEKSYQVERRPLYARPAPVPAVPELVSIIGELTSAIRSINRAPHHIAKGVDDDEPCYWQRKEWINWILELASSADEKSRAAMLNGGKS